MNVYYVNCMVDSTDISGHIGSRNVTLILKLPYINDLLEFVKVLREILLKQGLCTTIIEIREFSSRYTGIDISGVAIQQAKHRYPEGNFLQIRAEDHNINEVSKIWNDSI